MLLEHGAGTQQDVDIPSEESAICWTHSVWVSGATESRWIYIPSEESGINWILCGNLVYCVQFTVHFSTH